jgi:ribosomal protein L32E
MGMEVSKSVRVRKAKQATREKNRNADKCGPVSVSYRCPVCEGPHPKWECEQVSAADRDSCRPAPRKAAVSTARPVTNGQRREIERRAAELGLNVSMPADFDNAQRVVLDLTRKVQRRETERERKVAAAVNQVEEMFSRGSVRSAA